MSSPSALVDTISPVQVDAIQCSIVKTLLYFDIFSHPLTLTELKERSDYPGLTLVETQTALMKLCGANLVRHEAGMYFIADNLALLLRRKSGEEKSKIALEKARKMSGLISRFPFVRGVGLSGSLSKQYMDDQSDIDYFIITAPGRMWIARTLLTLYKKVILLNSKKFFCLNYFITTDTLSIPDRNLFTATELAFILPTYNYSLYRNLMESNEWYKEYYPNLPLRGNEWVYPTHNSLMKRFFEAMLNSRPGEWLDTLSFRLTLKFWKRKFAHFDATTFDYRLRSRKNESKHHPLGYHKLVMDKFEKKKRAFELENGIDLG